MDSDPYVYFIKISVCDNFAMNYSDFVHRANQDNLSAFEEALASADPIAFAITSLADPHSKPGDLSCPL